MVSDPLSPGLLARLPESPRKVALVRASRIGDFICATPAIRALRTALPGAEFTMIGLPFLRDLVIRLPHLDHFVEFPGFPGLAEQYFEPRRAVRFFEQMQAEQFDLAVQMNGSGVYSNPFTLMLGARVTAGFVRPGDPAGRLDAAFPLPDTGHEIQRVLSLATFMGADSSGEAPEFPLLDKDHFEAGMLLAGLAQPLIGVHPAAREATKRWPPERFGHAANGLQRDFGGTIVLLGGSEERALTERVAREVRGPRLNLAGRTSLGALGAVIARLSVLLTNDSGPAHVAYALGTPSVTVFGGTDPARWGPLSGPGKVSHRHVVLSNPVPCWPCDYWECPVGYQCLHGITVQEVTAAAESLLQPASGLTAERPVVG